MTRPEDALNKLFSLYVGFSARAPHITYERAFSAADVVAACEKLPISRVAGIEALRACQDSVVQLRKTRENPREGSRLIRTISYDSGNLASVSRGSRRKNGHSSSESYLA